MILEAFSFENFSNSFAAITCWY